MINNSNLFAKFNPLIIILEKMGNICCSSKDQTQSRGYGKSKDNDDFEETDTLSSHTNSNNVNVNDSLHLEYAQRLQRQQSKQ